MDTKPIENVEDLIITGDEKPNPTQIDSKASSASEYIIDSNGKYVKNPNYSMEMNTLHYAAAIGEGCILITNFAGEIQNGDYITSSPIAGYGALQSDDVLHSYTVAKCTETINWNSIINTITYEGQSYKSYQAACTYHCG
jgi:NDP-sugar pyrophosphorylase family protein